MKKQVNTVAYTKQDTFITPKVIELGGLSDSLKPPVKISSIMPRPIVSMVPNLTGNSYPIIDSKAEFRKLRLEQPSKISLPLLQNIQGKVIKDSLGNTFVLGNGGISNFTNFTTINGLALDAISCSKMDRLGNLWFGTFGGGVSRYDGKSFTNYTRYPNGFPKSPCNQVFNKTLKKIAEKIPSLNQDYEKKLIKGHKVERVKLKKYDMVVTHSARRSYCTNMYLRGVPIPTIMAISGHKTEENFLKYIKADNRKHAEILKAVYDDGERRKAELLKQQQTSGN